VELRPDYETFECRFVYGKKPPEMTSDPAFDTPCFAQCPISKMNGVETGSVERGKNAGVNLPRWAMDGDGGERGPREGGDGRRRGGGHLLGEWSRLQLRQAAGVHWGRQAEPRRWDAWGRLGLSERDTIEPIEINHEA